MLFGEGVLSASFIPVYAGLLARGKQEVAGRVAGVVFAILARLLTSTIVTLGVLATPLMVGLVAPRFDVARREMTIPLVRILFPGAGLLVMSAWCLGILNSHRKFFLSYSAPVLWNLVMIGALVGSRPVTRRWTRVAVAVAWASLSLEAPLSLSVQVPFVLRNWCPRSVLRLALRTQERSHPS